jgi:hypothetical protein
VTDAAELVSPDEDSYYQDPQGFFARLRESRPVAPVRMPAYGRAWVVTRYEDVRAVLTDPRMAKDVHRWPGGGRSRPSEATGVYARRIGYVAAVPKSQAVVGDAATLPEDDTEPPGWARYLLVRRSLAPDSKGELELAYYLCCARGRHRRRGADPRRRGPLGRRGVLPERQERDRPRPLPGPPLRRLVPARHPRRPRARLPRRHGGDRPKSPGGGLIPVTLAEVRRLLAHLTVHTPSRAAAWAWSNWRRRHQHRAKTSHYQRRQATYNEVLL